MGMPLPFRAHSELAGSTHTCFILMSVLSVITEAQELQRLNSPLPTVTDSDCHWLGIKPLFSPLLLSSATLQAAVRRDTVTVK